MNSKRVWKEAFDLHFTSAKVSTAISIKPQSGDETDNPAVDLAPSPRRKISAAQALDKAIGAAGAVPCDAAEYIKAIREVVRAQCQKVFQKQQHYQSPDDAGGIGQATKHATTGLVLLKAGP